MELWTLSLRTTKASCLVDADGKIFVTKSKRDSLAIDLLFKLDSLRGLSTTTWGKKTDSKAIQIKSLIKSYATLLLAGDADVAGFPKIHPVGIDSLAVVGQLLALAAQRNLSAITVASEFGYDADSVRVLVRSLVKSGVLQASDTLVLLPVGLRLSGITSPLSLVEDSIRKVVTNLTGLTGDTAHLRVLSSDTDLISSFEETLKASDVIAFQAKSNANGGPATLELIFSSGSLADTVAVVVNVASRNDAPTFGGVADLSKTLDTSATVAVLNWIHTISAGPANESRQSVRFEVVADSGANLFSVLPTVDSIGTLRFKALAAGRGVFRVRAVDNGDSTGSNLNKSDWKSFAIVLSARPMLTVTGLPDTLRLAEDSASTVPLVARNVHGGVLAVKFTPSGTLLVANGSWVVTPDLSGAFKISLQGKSNANGGPVVGIFKFSDSLDNASAACYVAIASRNDAPSFGGAANLVVVSGTSAKRYAGWIDSTSVGPGNESAQKVSFSVEVLSGASLFAVAPSVDSTGALSLTGKANSSGVAVIRVRAKDNGDSTGSNVNTSAWKSATITFDVAPMLTLSARSVSTFENVQVSAGTATVSDLETSANNLTLSWNVLDSAVLRHDSVYVGTAGGVRNIQLHPIAGTWGTSRIVFTLTDTLGAAVTDTMTLTVNAVNHAPTLVLKSPALLATTWKDEQTFALASASWDNVAMSQKGRFDLALSNPSDTAYLSSLRMDGVGVLHVLAKIDTSIAVKFKFRAHDSAGTANGGVDTSAWSAVQTLQLVDTVLDADGNSYRAKVLGTQTWMLSNLQRTAGTAACANDSCGKYGRQYTLDQALNNPTAADLYQTTYVTHTPVQGLCPEGWHVSTGGDWDTLKGWSGDSAFYKLRSKDTWTDTSYHLGKGYPAAPTSGTDRYGFRILATTSKITTDASSGDAEHAMGALFWTSTFNTGSGDLVLAEGVFAPNAITRYNGAGGGFSYTYSTASIRCAKDTTERGYGWIAP